MPKRSDDAKGGRRRTPADHLVVKHDAIRSEAVQSLVRNILIVGASEADVRLVVSLLRASLGRHVEARMAIGAVAAGRALGTERPNLVILRHTESYGAEAVDVVRDWRHAGIETRVVVILEHLTPRDAIAMRRADSVDVIEADDLNSVTLFEALLKAVPGAFEPDEGD